MSWAMDSSLCDGFISLEVQAGSKSGVDGQYEYDSSFHL